MALGQLPITRRRRTAFVILSTIGAVLLVAAFPYRFSGARLSVVWLMEAEALFLAGVFTREILFRRFGILAALIAAGHLLGKDAAQVFASRTESARALPELGLALVFVIAALILYANAHWVPRRWANLIETDFEEWCFRLLSYVAGVLAFVGAWLAWPGVWLAVAWSVLALFSALGGHRLNIKEFSLQTHFFAAAAVLRVPITNFEVTGSFYHVSLRAITSSMVIALLYLCSRWARGQEIESRPRFRAAYTWGAVTLLAWLRWHELPDAWFAVGWVTLALALSIVGSGLNIHEFFHQSYCLAAIAALRTVYVNLPLAEAHHHLNVRLLTVTIVAALLYLCARWAAISGLARARGITEALTWAASILVALLAMYELPVAYVGPAWCAIALSLVFIGSRLGRSDLSYQGHLIAAGSIPWIFWGNFGPASIGHFDLLLLETVVPCAALLYLCSPCSKAIESARSLRIPEAYTWVGSTLVSLLMWYELQPLTVALAWALFGLILFELGFARQSASLRFQGYVALAASFFRVFFVNLNAAGAPGEISPRVYTTVPPALAYYYVYGRLQDRTAQDFLAWDHRFQVAGIHSYLGTVALTSLILFELPPQGVVAAWAALILFLLATAWKLQQSLFLHQGLLLGLAVLFRAVSYNFFQPSYFTAPLLYSRLFWVSLTVALVFVAVPVAFRLRAKEEEAPEERRNRLTRAVAATLRHPEQVFFFIPFVLLTLLLRAEMRKGMVTVAWGVEAVAVFLFALWVGQRSYRLSGLGLLLLCVGKIVFVDVWGLSPRDRYLTFIVLGFALLIVSFLYTRYREVIRRYL